MIGFAGTLKQPTQRQADQLCKALFYHREAHSVMHNGGCTGSEEYALRYWLACKGAVWLHPPMQTTHRAAVPYGIANPPATYLRRYMQIVLATDVMIICPSQQREVVRSSTWAALRYAQDADKAFFLILPCGTVHQNTT
jgi:hypothetical protein